jgi:hypothetical protein
LYGGTCGSPNIYVKFEGKQGSEHPNLAEAEFEDLNARFFAFFHS